LRPRSEAFERIGETHASTCGFAPGNDPAAMIAA
jgi:hypothetical protein